jgi:hypothetical protein
MVLRQGLGLHHAGVGLLVLNYKVSASAKLGAKLVLWTIKAPAPCALAGMGRKGFGVAAVGAEASTVELAGNN